MTGAVVLAAGPGTRLGILGKRMAKTMLPVAGRPFLEHLAGRLLGAGLYPVVVAVNHHADTIVNHFTGHPLTAGLRFVHTDQRGTGADLIQCLDSLHTDDFIVWNGDTIADIDLPNFLGHADTQTSNGASRAVIALSRRPNVPNQNAWFVGDDGTVLATMEAEPRPAVPDDYAWRGSSTGILHLTKPLLGRFRNDDARSGDASFSDLYSGVLPELAERRELMAYDDGYRYFVDFGTRFALARIDHHAVTGWKPPSTCARPHIARPRTL